MAGLQTFHNNGGMILRSPGAEQTGEYPASDVRVYDEIGRNGERMLPFYRYLVIWSGLYTVHGGVTDWGNDTLGILSFSNELWNGGQYFTSPELKEQQKDPESPIAPRVANYFFNDYLEFGDELTEWKAFDHPQFGKVEIGGAFKKTFGRVPPRFMNEELCHRNMAFTLYQADEMPRMSIGETKVEKIADGVFKVWVDLVNDKVAPTILAKAAQNNVVPPDLLTVDGKGVEVLSASWVPSKWRPGVAPMIDQKDLKRIMVRNGQPGHTTRTVQYLVKGTGQHHREVRERQGRDGAEDDRAAVARSSSSPAIRPGSSPSTRHTIVSAAPHFAWTASTIDSRTTSSSAPAKPCARASRAAAHPPPDSSNGPTSSTTTTSDARASAPSARAPSARPSGRNANRLHCA